MASKRKQVHAVLDEIVRGLEGIDRPVLAKMRPVLRQAQREVERSLKQWLAREAVEGQARFTTQRYRNALVAIRKAGSTLNRLEGLTEQALWVGAETAGHMATGHLMLELEKFGAIFEGTIQPVAIDVGAVIVKGDKLLIDRFESSAARYAGTVRDTVVQELAISRVKSETMFELTNRLERRLPEIFTGQRHAAHRLARTETMQAYNVFHAEGIRAAKEDDDELVSRWDASFDWRRCPMCASLDGQVRDIANGEKFVAEWTVMRRKGPKHYKKSFEHAPAHPQCRCVVTVWHPSWAEMSRSRTPAAPAGHAEAEALLEQ